MRFPTTMTAMAVAAVAVVGVSGGCAIQRAQVANDAQDDRAYQGTGSVLHGAASVESRRGHHRGLVLRLG
jgi:hypothetical protein